MWYLLCVKCSAFIATSVDGYIATPTGGVDWLATAGKQGPEFAEHAQEALAKYLSSVDCMVMGRKCMEKISSMNLSAEQWPYGDIPIIVLSRTLSQAPENMRKYVELFSGKIEDLVHRLEARGLSHAYIDGGSTITSFLELGLLQELTITRAPILLGEGIPLFGKISRNIDLFEAESEVFPNNFIQVRYQVRSAT